MLDFSIIIPVYNAAPLLNRCLDSIFHQKTNYSYEVICIDDGSSDNSIEIIKNRKEKNIILYQQTNSGPAAARNKGIELAQGKYCAFIDADDYWIAGFIEKTIQYLEIHKNVVAVNVAQRHITISGDAIVPLNIALNEKPFIIEDFFSFWGKNMHICTGSAVMHTQAVKETGGQRIELRITEDLEFWAYLSFWGKWAFIPEVLFVSDGSDVTNKEGWLNKMEKRWNNAPSILEWEKRIIPKLPKVTESYKKARGRISRNLTYCQLLSKRLSLSRHEALKYGNYFTKDSIGILMNLAKYTPLTWWILSKLLRYREYHRK